MQGALEEAYKASKIDEVPVGAIVVDGDGRIISLGHNEKEKNKDASAHAEIIALKKAAENKGDWRLENCTLFVTLEPCPMCMSAISQFRIKTLVFGAYDKKGGALSLGYNFHNDERLNHKFNVIGGIHHYPCSNILSKFFKEKRSKYKFNNET